MTSPVPQRDWASPPAFVPLRFRLRDAVDGPHPFTGHQKLGVYFQPDDCSFPLETTAQCVSGIGAVKTPTADLNYEGAEPFVLYTWLDCGLVGVGYDELRERTLRAHQHNAQTVAEEVFWTGGQFDVNPHLAYAGAPITEVVGGSTVNLQTAATTITGTYDITKAISLLEQAMAGCYGGTPLIHVPRGVTAFLSQQHLIETVGEQIRTRNGSVIVPAPGYPGTSPAGVAPTADTTFIYATGNVKMWESNMNFITGTAKEMLVRTTNETTLIIEQWFMFGWDCCHFAIQVDLPNTST